MTQIHDETQGAADDAAPSGDEWFWTRTELKHIREFARAYGAGPYATLGVVLVRCAVATEPPLTLPALVGGPGSLNLFLGLVGPSGNGKDAATAAGNRAVRLLNEVAEPLDVPELPLGSGEGIRASYVVPGRPSKDDPHPEPVTIATRAMFSASEIDGAAALAARNGSTLMAELRKVWVGASIGAANAGAQFRIVVPAHTYRAGVIAGVQPARSGLLLGDADGGTPQRWLFLPTTDPGAPAPAEDSGEMPDMQPIDVAVNSGTGNIVMKVPPEVIREIRMHRHAVLTEKPGINPLDGHRLFLREKIAAALAILAGRTREIIPEDWELAGHLMNVSDNTRDKCAQVLNESQRQQNKAKAHAQADREDITEQRREDRERTRVRRKVLATLATGEWMSRGELNRGLKSDMRAHLDATLTDLTAEGRITSRPGKRTPEYRSWTE